ncbi:glycoside hydrolase family 78 protein [Cadophora sp. DSE1049]|nr:glycoside hydrolase family 78 protein [Cadophora sp. DSE1049]
MSVTIASLTFEHHRSPIGIGEAMPRLSWRFDGSAQFWTQEAYDIEIQRNSCSSPELYTVASQTSVLAPWPSSPLKSSESATVRVRAYAHGGLQTPWSEPAVVETGLLRVEDWTAALIETTHEIDAKTAHPPTLFRRLFKLKGAVRSARLYVTAHGVYEAHINGERVGDDVLAPGWTNYNYELPYQTFDVTSLLKAGADNAIGIQVAEGWYCGRLGAMEGGRRINFWGNRIGVIAQLAVTYEDERSETIVSDGEWKYSASAVLESSIYNGEIYDLAKEQVEWSSPGFDAKNWILVGLKEHDKTLLRAPDGPPLRPTQRMAVKEIIKSPSGKTILDFGQNLVGYVQLQVPQGLAGHEITFIHTEVLEKGECATAPLRTARATDKLILAGGTASSSRTWHPSFTYHGFRYVEITNWPNEDVDSTDFTAIIIHTDMKRLGTFECSDPQINRLHENVVWSMRGNFFSIPTDCPQRDERLGWTGDVQAFAPTASFLYDCNGILKAWLRTVAAEQKAGGNGVPPLAPMAIWCDCTVLVPWDLYKASGDPAILLAQFASMEDWLENGIPRNEQGLWAQTTVQLGDWLDPNAPPGRPDAGITDGQLVANAFLVQSTTVMSKICAVLGYNDKATSYAQQATKLRALFADEYITPHGRTVSDSQTAIALCILFDLFPTPEQRVHAIERIKFLICDKSRFKIATGFAGTPILGPALTAAGQTQLFYRMLMNTRNPSWLYSVKMGATTMWERWDSMLPDGSLNSADMTSFNHFALGSIGHWMHATIGGLKILEPGWKRFSVAPELGGRLTSAKVEYESPYGAVRSAWRVEGAEMVLDVKVPPNSTAEVKFGSEVTSVGSGEYSFRTTKTFFPFIRSKVGDSGNSRRTPLAESEMSESEVRNDRMSV